MFAHCLHLIALLDKDAGVRWTSDLGCPWGAIKDEQGRETAKLKGVAEKVEGHS